MNAPDRAVAPGGCMVKIIHLTATGNPSWRGQRDAPARDGWWWTVTAPGGIELAAVWIGPALPDCAAIAKARRQHRKIPRADRAALADVRRAAAELEVITASLPVRPFRLADLRPVEVHDAGVGYRGGAGIPRFGADPSDQDEASGVSA